MLRTEYAEPTLPYAVPKWCLRWPMRQYAEGRKGVREVDAKNLTCLIFPRTSAKSTGRREYVSIRNDTLLYAMPTRYYATLRQSDGKNHRLA